jgi:hypothetical protein
MQKTPFVDKGDVVKQGDNIGLLGNTGTATTGAHLHLSYCAEESLVGGLSCSAPAVKGSVNDTRLHMSLPAEYESLSAFLAKTKTND